MPEQFLHGVEVVEIDSGDRPIATAASSIIAIIGTAPRADVLAFPVNTPVMVANSRTLAAKLLLGVGDSDGTLPDAMDSIFDQAGAAVIVIRVEEGIDDAATLANVLGGTNAVTGAYEGVHALLAAESVTGFKPRILIAPGFTHRTGVTANAVVAEMAGIAERLRAVVIADGPSTTDADVITAAGDNGGKRVFLVDPRVLKVDSAGATVSAWSSAVVAGVIARTDNSRGWWVSPSNQEIYGVVGTERAIDFSMSDPASRSNLLNVSNVATIIRQNGFRLWGNRTLSADPRFSFLCVVRTADIIADSLQAAHLWAVDRGITKTYVEDVREGVNAFLRNLKSVGAILGGSCWLDPELNSASNIAAGKVYWDFDFTPVYPAEHLTFRSHLVDNYIAEIF
jgi:uncharacterized protein